MGLAPDYRWWISKLPRGDSSRGHTRRLFMPAQNNGATGANANVIDIAPLVTRVGRGSKIPLSPVAITAPYGSAVVTTGARPVGSDNHEDVIVIVDGSTRTAFPQSAVLTAIMHDLLPREVVKAGWPHADKTRAA